MKRPSGFARLSRYFVLALAFQVVGFSLPTDYVIDFTLDPTHIGKTNFDVVPTSGHFTYDSANSVAPFSNFIVDWDGISFDLTSQANSESAAPGICGTQVAAPNLAINILFQTFTSPCGDVENYTWMGLYQTDTHQSFRFMSFIVDYGQIQIVRSFNPGVLPDVARSGEGSWTVSQVPEPASVAFVALGFVMMTLFRKRMRRRRTRA